MTLTLKKNMVPVNVHHFLPKNGKLGAGIRNALKYPAITISWIIRINGNLGNLIQWTQNIIHNQGLHL